LAKTGEDALSRFGLGKYSVGQIMKNQIMITGVGWALAFLGLTLTKQKYLEMKRPEADAVRGGGDSVAEAL
jgi:hypothetical protein